MRTPGSSRQRAVLLIPIYLLGVLGIIASNGSGDVDYSSGCDIEISGIAPVTGSSGDIWVGITTRTGREAVHGVLRLADDGSTVTSYTFDDMTDETLVATVAVAVDPLNSGDVYVGGDFDNRILRLNSDGTRDTGFAVGSGFDGRVNSIVPANDGSGDIYVGGNFTSYNGSLVSGLVRLDSDGSRDGGFVAAVSNVESVAPATDAPWVGYVYSGGRTIPTAARWQNNGLLDTNFDPAIAEVFAVATASDASGDIYAGGNAATGVVRLNTDGSNNAGFNGSGFDARILDILVAGDMTGDIYVAGGFTSYDGASANGIVRLADDGTRRNSFDIDGGFTDDTGSPAPVTSVALAGAGSADIYAGGSFSFYAGVKSKGIARLNEDGSLDPAFAIQLPAGGDFCRSEAFFILE